MRVCVLTTCFPELPFTLLEKLFKSCYLSWSQGSVKLKPCRSSRRCPVLRSQLRPSSALFRVSSCFVSTGVELFRTPPPLPLFLLFPLSHSTRLLKHPGRPAPDGVLKSRQLGRTQRRFFRQMDGRRSQTAASVSSLSCTRQKLFLRRMMCTKWVLSLFLFVNPPSSIVNPFISPPVCSSLSMPWMFMMLFISKMTINFTLLLFFYEYIYR